MQGIRQRNVAPGSALGELFFRTDPETGTANDYGQVFVFPRAVRIDIVELGIAANSFTGTGASAQISYLATGLDGNEALIQTPLTAGYTSLYNHNGTAYDIAAAGFRCERAESNQGYLAQLLQQTSHGQIKNSFDSETNLHFRLEVNKDTLSLWDGFAWCKARIWYPEDL